MKILTSRRIAYIIGTSLVMLFVTPCIVLSQYPYIRICCAGGGSAKTTIKKSFGDVQVVSYSKLSCSSGTTGGCTFRITQRIQKRNPNTLKYAVVGAVTTANPNKYCGSLSDVLYLNQVVQTLTQPGPGLYIASSSLIFVNCNGGNVLLNSGEVVSITVF